jgi:hypothetical protein
MLDLPAARTFDDSLVPPGTGGVVAHRMVRLAGGLVLIEMELAAPAPPGVAELLAEGEALPPPTAAITLAEAAASRLLFVARDVLGLLRPGASVAVRRGETPLGAFRLDPPGAPAPLLTVRPASERAALLRFFTHTLAPLFGAGAEGDFAAALHALAAAVARDAGTTPVRPL